MADAATHRRAGVRILSLAMEYGPDGWTRIPDGLVVLEMLGIIPAPVDVPVVAEEVPR